MRLTQFSDYALRLLVVVALAKGKPVTIAAAAKQLKVSNNHLMKVSNVLTRSGILSGIRGRSGGLLLKREPHEIGIGELFRLTEPDFDLTVCLSAPRRCPLHQVCGAPPFLTRARAAFFHELDGRTLADVLATSC
jgi:Rrf2 family nitric oxide-sensitive transcriptional repressor